MKSLKTRLNYVALLFTSLIMIPMAVAKWIPDLWTILATPSSGSRYREYGDPLVSFIHTREGYRD